MVFKSPPQPLNATGIKHFTGTHFPRGEGEGWTKDEEGVKPIREEVVRGGHDAGRYKALKEYGGWKVEILTTYGPDSREIRDRAGENGLKISMIMLKRISSMSRRRFTS